MEYLFKSVRRVKDIGEVFTPKKTVNLMLNQKSVKKRAQDLYTTFLEPSAGEGVFLTAILNRKMKSAQKLSHNVREYGNNCLQALSTLYGIELMEDNVEMLVMNMASAFDRNYFDTVKSVYEKTPDQRVIKSSRTIIQANMSQGDALQRVTSSGQPIIFSDWQVVGYGKVQRTEYTLESIIKNEGPSLTVSDYTEEMDLFSDYMADQRPKNINRKTNRYVPVKWVDVYKMLIEQVD